MIVVESLNYNEPILFIDFHGTLCLDTFWRSLPASHYVRIQEILLAPGRTLVNEWMRGKRTAEEVNSEFARELGMNESDLWEVFVRDCRSMHVDEATLLMIHELRDRFVTVLMTDNMDSFDRFTVPALKLGEYFDVIVNSYHEGRLKGDNDGHTFNKILAQHKASITESILIDDSAQACELFRALGGTALQVTSEKPLSYLLTTV